MPTVNSMEAAVTLAKNPATASDSQPSTIFPSVRKLDLHIEEGVMEDLFDMLDLATRAERDETIDKWCSVFAALSRPTEISIYQRILSGKDSLLPSVITDLTSRLIDKVGSVRQLNIFTNDRTSLNDYPTVPHITYCLDVCTSDDLDVFHHDGNQVDEPELLATVPWNSAYQMVKGLNFILATRPPSHDGHGIMSVDTGAENGQEAPESWGRIVLVSDANGYEPDTDEVDRFRTRFEQHLVETNTQRMLEIQPIRRSAE